MRILIAIDDSQFSEAIADFVRNHAWGKVADIVVLHVQEPLLVGSYLSLLPSPLIEDIKSKAVEEGKKRLAWLADKLTSILPTATIETRLLEGSPQEQIIECAREWKADLVVVGARGKSSAQRMLLGSVSQAVCALSPCSVLVVKEPR